MKVRSELGGAGQGEVMKHRSACTGRERGKFPFHREQPRTLGWDPKPRDGESLERDPGEPMGPGGPGFNRDRVSRAGVQ